MTSPERGLKVRVVFRCDILEEESVFKRLMAIENPRARPRVLKDAILHRAWRESLEDILGDWSSKRHAKTEVTVQMRFHPDETPVFGELLALQATARLRPTLLKLRILRPTTIVPSEDVLRALAEQDVLAMELRRRLLFSGAALSAAQIRAVKTEHDIVDILNAAPPISAHSSAPSDGKPPSPTNEASPKKGRRPVIGSLK